MHYVILHGWGHDKTYWEGVAARFHKDSVQILDLPGFGEEKLTSSKWGILEYARWVEGKIENKGRGIVLVGHSFGGKIASYIASGRPKWLKGLVLIGAPSIYRPSVKTKAKIRTYKVFKRVMPGFLRDRARSEEYREAIEKGKGEVFVRTINQDFTKELKKINVPTLLLWGENDQDVPLRIANEMNSLIPNSKLVLIPDAGHNVHLERPDLVYANIKKFIKND